MTNEQRTTGSTLTVSHYGLDQLDQIRGTLLDVYAEVYAREIQADPFFSMERFDARLAGHTSVPGWGCTIGEVAGEVVGYAYGYPLRAGKSWWRGLRTPVADELTEETGHRTFGLAEIMVREPWRGTGIARTIHDELMSRRTEERAALLVERAHPRVRALYERWGYRWFGEVLPFPDAPVYDAMVLILK
jgi:GNAT superfamily N-acetyltransferase